MEKIKHIINYIIIFFITLLLLTGALIISAKISKSAIKENTKESAEYLCEGELFGTVVDGVNGSKIDRYADSVLLGIAYQYDSEHPLKSVMLSSYYYSPIQNENDNLFDAVNNGYEANQQYLRYWHGSNAIVRPLLTIFNIEQIYVFNGIIIGALVVTLLVMLLKKKEYILAVGVVIGLVMTSSWFVPLSLEYTWTYIVMLIMSVVGLILIHKSQWKYMGIFFMVGGMVTSYLDFLTTETLTLLVPLLIVMWVDSRNKSKCSTLDIFRNVTKTVIPWGCGYAGMWMMKWVMASVILGENVTPYVYANIEERMLGSVGSRWECSLASICRNVSCLLPYEYGSMGLLIGILLILLALYLGFVYRKKEVDKGRICIYLLIGLVPYIRYIVVLNHSYLHYFFTYRAQMATIIAIVLILGEMVEWRWIFNANARKRKR